MSRLWGPDYPASEEILSRPVTVDPVAQRVLRLQAIARFCGEARECARNTAEGEHVGIAMGSALYVIEGLLEEDGVKPAVPF